MANHEIITDISTNEIITAERLNRYGRGINQNAVAIKAPSEALQANEDITGAESEIISDEVFSATVTESDQVATDSNGDTTTLKRVDNLVCTETTTGRTMTISITYV